MLPDRLGNALGLRLARPEIDRDARAAAAERAGGRRADPVLAPVMSTTRSLRSGINAIESVPAEASVMANSAA